MEDTKPVFRSDSRLGCGWGRERELWSTRRDRTCIYEIFTMCEALSVLYIFLLLILTSAYWVDIIIPDILMRTWRLNNVSKIKQWWSWSLKIGLSDFKSLVFPDVPWDPKTVLFLPGFCKLPFWLLPKHQFSPIRYESCPFPSSPSPQSSHSQSLCASSSRLGAHLTLQTQHSLPHLFLGFHSSPG